MAKHRKQHHHLSTEHRIKGIKAALASPRTPVHLRPSLERQLRELDERGAGGKTTTTTRAARRKPRQAKSRKRLFDFLPF